MPPHDLRINTERFQTNFEYLAQIGAGPDGGVNRPTFSDAHLQARAWFREYTQAARLNFRVDGAGNHAARLNCGPAQARTLLLGSHLDTVPNGGRFDGALGVLAALEVIQTVQDAALEMPFQLEVIDFTDEEGTLFGLLGSSAFTGKLRRADLAEPRGGREKLLAGLTLAKLTETGLCNAQRDPQSLAGYLELHIEQGARLSAAQADIGIVTSIVGIGSYQITFVGCANHAGTTAMKSRRDAAQGASAFTLALRELVLDKFPDCVANVGNMHFEPGAFNIIPERVTASVEFRAPAVNTFDDLENALLQLAQEQARKFGLTLETEFLGKHPPASMSAEMQAAFKQAARSLQLSAIPLASGAGHDAQSLAAICPAGMIFVPSVDGISHSPAEFTAWADCVNGANMLLAAVLELASTY